MFRPTIIAVAVAAMLAAGGGLAVAADRSPDAHVSTPPTGSLEVVLEPTAFSFADVAPKRSGDRPPSPGDASIITYRVLDASGQQRIGRAQFVCVATDRRGRHEQCSGTIALPGGQIATQGDAENVAIVGGTGAYAGARGTATGEDHPDSVDVTLHFLP